jgi:RuvA, C-terminal domain
MTSQIIASLVSAALIAAGLAMVLAGPSIVIAARFIFGWFAAFVAIILALAALTTMAVEYLANHVSGAPGASAAVSVLAIGAISLAGLRIIGPSARSSRATITKAATSVAANATGRAAEDAVSALRSLGYSKGDAASAVASASALLEPQADVSTLVKTALRRVPT